MTATTIAACYPSKYSVRLEWIKDGKLKFCTWPLDSRTFGLAMIEAGQDIQQMHRGKDFVKCEVQNNGVQL